MKEKILQLLRAKFQGTHNVVLDRVADHLSQTVKEESELETAIAGVEPLVKSFSEVLQTETDRISTKAQETALKNWREKHGLDENGKPIQNPNPPAGGQGKSNGGGKDDEVPAWAKQLQETVTKLSGTVESVTQKQTEEQRRASIRGKLKEKGVSEKHMDLFSGRVNLDSEDLDKEVERVAGEYTAFRQDLINEEVEKGNYTPQDSFEKEDNIVDDLNNWGKKFETKTD